VLELWWGGEMRKKFAHVDAQTLLDCKMVAKRAFWNIHQHLSRMCKEVANTGEFARLIYLFALQLKDCGF